MTHQGKSVHIKIILTPQEAAEIEAVLARDGFKKRGPWAYWLVMSHARRVALGAKDEAH